MLFALTDSLLTLYYWDSPYFVPANVKLSGNDDDDGWRDSKCRSHPLINGCDKNYDLASL